MAALGNLKVLLEMEPIVKLLCEETGCVHNLAVEGMFACNLKHLTIVDGGVCHAREMRKGAGEKREEEGL